MIFMLVLSGLLWPAWRHNPDLSHGLLMPVIFLFLIHESRTTGPRRFLLAGRGTSLAAILASAGLLVVGVAGIYAAVLDWSHARSCNGVSPAASPFSWPLASSVFRTTGSGSCLSTGPPPPRSFFGPSAPRFLPGPIPESPARCSSWSPPMSCTPCTSWGWRLIARVTSSNWPLPESESKRGLQRSSPSLVSCVFAGLFFSATLVRRPWARVLIIALAAPLALTMNFLRSLALTLLANAGTDIGGAWHDATGVGVLVLTALILGGLAVFLERRGRTADPSSRLDSATPSGGVAPLAVGKNPAAQWFLATTLSLAAVLVFLFYLNTRPSLRRDAPVPNLWAILPDSAAGWQVGTTRDLSRFEDILQTDLLAQRIYQRGTGADQTTIILYLAYWRPNQAPVSQVALHTPDACWPGVGWVLQDPPPTGQPLQIAGRSLPDAETRLFTYSGSPQYVWFWHLYDGRPLAFQNPYSITELLSIAWHFGFRHGGDQLFVRASSNRPWSEISREPLMKQFFAGIRPMGL